MDSPAPLDRITLELADEAATIALAARVAAVLRRGDLVALTGDLGAGKTAFARALINALPAAEDATESGAREEVPSPTYTLVQVYERAGLTVWHFDLYRLERPDEVWELGLEDALAEGVSLIEWPERLGAGLPDNRLELQLAIAPAQSARRRAILVGRGTWAPRVRALAEPGERTGPF